MTGLKDLHVIIIIIIIIIIIMMMMMMMIIMIIMITKTLVPTKNDIHTKFKYFFS